MIELRHLSRWYGLVIGLNDVSCQIGPGITALIGQNGAGKSTLMRMITGQIKPTTGDIQVFGQAPFANPEVYKRLGYCPEIDQFYERQSGREFLVHMARLCDIGSAQAKSRVEELLHAVGMAERADRPIAGYSKGMRQRIKLAQAMILDPDILLLDEPLNGLDPVGRHEYMTVIGELAERGKAVIISSHILYEVEQLTRNILLLHRGRLLAKGNLRTIRGLIDSHPQIIKIKVKEKRELMAALCHFPEVIRIALDIDDSVIVEVQSTAQFYSKLGLIIAENDWSVSEIASPDNNLESVFRYLVGG